MALTKSVAEIISNDKSGLLAKHPSWSRVPLSEVAEILNGYPFESEKFSKKDGTPLIRIRDVLTGKTETYYNGNYDETFAVSPGDLLVGMDGDFNSARWKAGRGLLNQRVCKVTVKSQYYADRFLEYVVPGFLAAINAETSSVTVKHLSSRTIGEIDLPLPPLGEQFRIVEKLDELLTELDSGVAELKAAQAKLTQYRQSILKAAVEGALTADWRAERARRRDGAETGAQLLKRILAERRKRWEAKLRARFKEQGKVPPKGWQDKYPEPVKVEAHDFPELPEGWVWASIGECFHVAVGATPSRKRPEFWAGEIPWASSGEVQFCRISKTRECISEEGLRNSSTQINPSGSILLGMIGEGKTRGQVAILDIAAANNQNCAAIWVSETPIPSEYVYCWLWSRYNVTRRRSSGNNQPALNKTIVESIPLPLPFAEECKLIATRVLASMAVIDLQEREISNALKRADAQRKNILKAAFSGQLVPQDLSEEPASALLERIRAECDLADKTKAVRKPRTPKVSRT